MNNNLVWRVGRKPTYVSLSSKMKTLVALVLMPMGALALELNPSFSPEAVAKYQERADAGDAEAQYLYSEALASGQGIAKNQSKAMEYAQKAAAQGFGLAFRRVGVGYENGWGVVSNATEATKWYGEFLDWAKPEAEKGNAHAQFNIGRCFWWGEGVAEDKTTAVKWCLTAAEHGNAEAQARLGWCYDQGVGVAVNFAEAEKWYRKAAEQGYATAQSELAVSYFFGNRFGLDVNEANKWLSEALKQEDVRTQWFMGVGYSLLFKEKDESEAVKWYRKAAEQGYDIAQVDLAKCYTEGKGVTSNYEEAVKWYRKAAELGNAEAQFELAVCYAEGKGTKKNVEESARWYRKAAEQGHAKAQFELGRCYTQGNGVSRNDVEAVKWYSKAAGQGITDARFALSKCYWKGVGVLQDRVKAVKLLLSGTWRRIGVWIGIPCFFMSCFLLLGLMPGVLVPYLKDRFRDWLFKRHEKKLLRAAEHGDAEAQYEVARRLEFNVESEIGEVMVDMIAFGTACPICDKAAEMLEWYRKAAEQGHVKAQCKLGSWYKLYRKGEEAAKWYRKAAEQGNADAQKELDKLLSENLALREER